MLISVFIFSIFSAEDVTFSMGDLLIY